MTLIYKQKLSGPHLVQDQAEHIKVCHIIPDNKTTTVNMPISHNQLQNYNKLQKTMAKKQKSKQTALMQYTTTRAQQK